MAVPLVVKVLFFKVCLEEVQNTFLYTVQLDFSQEIMI